MKLYFLIVVTSSLLLINFIIPAKSTEIESVFKTELIATEVNSRFEEYARSISVKINSGNNNSSGVIIGKKDNQYLVITNNQTPEANKTLIIETVDGMQHQANTIHNSTLNNNISLLIFSSNKTYEIAQTNGAATGRKEQNISTIGFATKTKKFTLEEGIINRVFDEPLKEGYQIGYKSNIASEINGGVILDAQGDLIGINGNNESIIFDEELSAPEEIEQLKQLSWGISMQSLLTQLDPAIINTYNLPLPKTIANIENTSELLTELESKAKQFTVRIDSSSEENGSGVIIAKQGNTYTVLTASHVVCKEEETNNCDSFTYSIVTFDGKQHPLNISTIKRREGIDLAVVEFTSNETYKVAELANYPITKNDAVFVTGYPKLSKKTSPKWRFSMGFGFDREQGLFNVNDNSLSTDSSGLSNSQNSLVGGYEMVYTSITYGGMSGGAVLDINGKVIGIHGLAEGETALDNQSGLSESIQLGYSLGIPINTFIGLADRLEIDSILSLQRDRDSFSNSGEQILNSFRAIELQLGILETEISQGNATAEIWLERGNQLWRLFRYSEAVEAFDKAIALDPEFVHLAYYGKGLALGNIGEYELALASLEQATEIQTNFEPAYSLKSLIFTELNRFEEALVAINRAILQQPNSANRYGEQGKILSALKRYSEADTAYKKALTISPRASFYYSRGLLLQEQGKLDLAVNNYNQAIEINSNLADAYYNRGKFYSKNDETELALADYNQTIEILQKRKRRVELALDDYNQAIEINPNNSNAYYYRGILYFDKQEINLALADWNKAIKINPNNANVYAKLGKIYLQIKEFTKAQFNLQKAQQLYTTQGDTFLAQQTHNLLNQIP